MTRLPVVGLFLLMKAEMDSPLSHFWSGPFWKHGWLPDLVSIIPSALVFMFGLVSYSDSTLCLG